MRHYAPSWFDASTAPPQERAGCFARTFGSLMGIDMVSNPRTIFSARLLRCELPGATLVSCFAPTARFIRRPAAESAPEGTGLVLLRPMGGAMTLTQDGHRHEIADGDAVMLSLTHAFQYETAGLTRVDLLRVKDLPGLPDADAIEGLRRATAENNTLRLLIHYAGAILQGLIPLPSDRHAQMASTHMRDLAAVVFVLDQPPARRALRPNRLAEIKTDLAHLLQRPDLSLDQLAQRHDVSPRLIQKLFEADGTTFTAYVRDRRLDLAGAALREADGRAVSAIAFDSGFSDLSYFNRAFRLRFGVTPSTYRARAAAGEQRPRHG